MHPGSLGSWEGGGMWNVIGLQVEEQTHRVGAEQPEDGLNDCYNRHTHTHKYTQEYITICTNTANMT